MSAKPDARGTQATIARSGKRKWGYDTKQVDAFLERAHSLYESQDPDLTQEEIANASFDLCKNGYIITQVDAALSRLERVISDRQTSLELARVGVDGWTTRMVSLQAELAAHAGRTSGSVFRRGDPGMPSYDCKQVERLIEQILNKTSDLLNLQEGRKAGLDKPKNTDITADRVSNVIFTQRRGAKGYDERQVDFFLAKAIELLEQLESFARVGEKSKTVGAGSPVPAASAQTQFSMQNSSASNIQPLIRQSQTPAWNNASAPVAESMGATVEGTPNNPNDFAQLHQAERAIFEAPTASTQPMPPVQPNSSLGALASAVNKRLAQDDAQASTDAGAAVAGTAPAAESSSARQAYSAGVNSGPAAAPVNSAAMPVSEPAVQSVPFSHTPSSSSTTQTPSTSVASTPAAASEGDAFSFSASPESSKPTSNGADADESPAPGSTSIISSPFVDGPLGAGGPLGSYDESAPEKSAPQERPSDQTAGSGTDSRQSVSDTPDWAKPRYSPNAQGGKSEDQDPDSYLASLLNQDLPKIELDIPDISFPGFGDDAGKDDSTQ